MGKKHNPLNEAIIHQILHLLRNGEVRRCLDMGLDPEILSVLQSPSALSVLLNSSALWCQILVDQDMVKRLLSTKDRSDEETRMVQRALRLGATTPMLQQFFGMSPQDVALQRVIVGVPGKPGRNRDVPDDTPLWHRFVHLMDEFGADYQDPMALLDIAMLITEEVNIPLDQEAGDATGRVTLGLIWHKIQQWISEGLYPAGTARKPASLILLTPNPSRKRDRSSDTASGQLTRDENLGQVEGERM
jgi:hypothetical protein